MQISLEELLAKKAGAVWPLLWVLLKAEPHHLARNIYVFEVGLTKANAQHVLLHIFKSGSSIYDRYSTSIRPTKYALTYLEKAARCKNEGHRKKGVQRKGRTSAYPFRVSLHAVIKELLLIVPVQDTIAMAV